MALQIIDLTCPGCGGGVSTEQKQCVFCGRPIVISSFNDIQSLEPFELNKYANNYRKALAEHPDNKDLNASIAICYMKLKLYDQAGVAFEKCLEDNFDNSEVFFYAACCLLKGQKAFVTPRMNIDKIVEYLNAAIMIEPRGIYYYFLAYVKQDYFERKYLNCKPNWKDTLQTAVQMGLPVADVTQLSEILQVEIPRSLSISV
jgi:tetratricopeptide (TPR) repeat protein